MEVKEYGISRKNYLKMVLDLVRCCFHWPWVKLTLFLTEANFKEEEQLRNKIACFWLATVKLLPHFLGVGTLKETIWEEEKEVEE